MGNKNENIEFDLTHFTLANLNQNISPYCRGMDEVLRDKDLLTVLIIMLDEVIKCNLVSLDIILRPLHELL